MSTISYTTRLDMETGNGCFYEKKLLSGIQVEIYGQSLVSVGDKLMTHRKAQECYFAKGSGLEPKSSQIYINLGLNAASYPIIAEAVGGNNDVIALKELYLNPTYTENFALRHISFLRLARRADMGLLKQVATKAVTHYKLWGDKKIDGQSVTVETGIVAVSRIVLKFSDKVIYELGTPLIADTEEESEGDSDNRIGDLDKYCRTSDVIKALFILSNRNLQWMDYEVAWQSSLDCTS